MSQKRRRKQTVQNDISKVPIARSERIEEGTPAIITRPTFNEIMMCKQLWQQFS